MVAAQADDLIERAMCEIVSQRQLFRQSQQRKIKRLSPEWQEAIERGEELLMAVQRRRIEGGEAMSLLWQIIDNLHSCSLNTLPHLKGEE